MNSKPKKRLPVRIYFLRLLVASWMIPTLTVVGIPMWYLMAGWDEAISCWKDMAKSLWYGER